MYAPNTPRRNDRIKAKLKAAAPAPAFRSTDDFMMTDAADTLLALERSSPACAPSLSVASNTPSGGATSLAPTTTPAMPRMPRGVRRVDSTSSFVGAASPAWAMPSCT